MPSLFSSPFYTSLLLSSTLTSPKCSPCVLLAALPAVFTDLVRQLLEPFGNLPDPTTPLSSLDLSLIKVAKQLSGIPSNLFSDLKSPNPLNFAPLMDLLQTTARLQAIQKHRQPDSSPSIPEIRLESDALDDTSEGSAAESRSPGPMILHASNALGARAHEKHTTALLRLLYLHFAVNPGNLSPHIPALLLSLYSVLNQEVEPEDFAHQWLANALN
ncbi:hypothetical protein DFH05DRAFT_1519679 [Lentinula detonsa]|uniref:Uncharacterized protein n=1 Tax=Lentinula detonsa TaxID=2804962 RepID=A0A9W8U3W2_9AGAR|nr:hypothetical protein DFH05DRAFT_1519679 [Lentinula detonsa]